MISYEGPSAAMVVIGILVPFALLVRVVLHLRAINPHSLRPSGVLLTTGPAVRVWFQADTIPPFVACITGPAMGVAAGAEQVLMPSIVHCMGEALRRVIL
jgi:hypothetical protein